MPSEIITERKVGSIPIGKSFKGILRISNVKTLENEVDNFSNSNLYGEFDYAQSGQIWEPVGSQGTTEVLDGTNPRYFYGNEFTNGKIPVTDSLGNWLNFSLGADSSSIGNDTASGLFNPHDNPEIKFFTLTGDSATVGLEERKIPSDKLPKGGELHIQSFDGNPAQIIIDTYRRYGLVGSEDGVVAGIEDISDDVKHRVIYQSSVTPRQFDAFIYRQENYTSDKSRTELHEKNAINKVDENGNIVANTTSIEPGVKNCYVKLENLRDYVFDKVSSYIKFNTTEIPPGTLIDQYCSLSKWYCSVGSGINDDQYWQGYRPSLGGLSSTFNEGNTEQGVYSNPTYIDWVLTSYTTESVELPPDFKRGYVLADGKSYEIRLMPNYSSDTDAYGSSIKTQDLFLKLYFIIGYYYTKFADILTFPHRIKIENGVAKHRYDYSNTGENNFFYTKGKLEASSGVSNETLFGIHLATILAFKKFEEGFADPQVYNSLLDENGKLDIDAAIEWLSNQVIDEEFVFNTVFNKETLAKEADNDKIANLIYTHTDASTNNEVEIVIGQEVNTFSDYIQYYTFGDIENEAPALQHCACRICDMAEIYDMLRLYRDKSEVWGNYRFAFNIPKLYTNEDNDVNENTSISGNGSIGNVGLFVGSNALLAADNVKVPSKSALKTVDDVYDNVTDHYTYQQSNCIFTLGFQPHSHAIAKGVMKIGKPKDKAQYDYIEGMTYNPLQTISTDGDYDATQSSYNTIYNINSINNNIVSADFTYSLGYKRTPGDVPGPQEWSNSPEIINYVLQERGAKENVKLKTIHNGLNGMMGKELRVFDKNGNELTDMKWYGRTSPPIWDLTLRGNKVSEKGDLEGGTASYFKPHSIKLLPLIKL